MRRNPHPNRTLVSILLCALVVPLGLGCHRPCNEDSIEIGDPYRNWQDIEVTPPTVEIEPLAAGTEQRIEVTVSNEGENDLEFDSVSLASWSDSSFQLDEATIPELLEPDEETVVAVDYTAGALIDRLAALDFRTNDPDEGRATVVLQGRSVQDSPHASLASPIIDFGFQYIDQEDRLQVQISNESADPFRITSIELVQSEAAPAFHLGCPGVPVANCTLETWNNLVAPDLLADEVTSEAPAVIEVVFLPTNLQEAGGLLQIATTDPQRPVLTGLLRGNADNGAGCTAPTIAIIGDPGPFGELTEPTDHLQVSVHVSDSEQPAHTLLVELFLADQLYADEFAGTDGNVAFDLIVDYHELPAGLHTFTLRVTDGCPKSNEATFVASVLQAPAPPTLDTDGDGWPAGDEQDCDDTNPDIYPHRVELFDDLDNDCDGAIDEGTEGWDNDCDGYCAHSSSCHGQGPAPGTGDDCTGLASEPFGDCDDSAADVDGDGIADGSEVFPGATESPDYRDQDCNGTVDEGTSLADDDGDGFNENGFSGGDRDCDDTNPQVFPGAIEWCNELDADCDGEVDNDCIDASPSPRIAGDLRGEDYLVPLGGETQVQVTAFSSDEALTYQWTADTGTFDSDVTDEPFATWIAPEAGAETADLIGGLASLAVDVTDSGGQRST
ncbi:MAG: hypothetical protein CL928_17830, partial [Deltaproteobacteria bacterium]|nr:hypothetical protein [Deltaproteobacteria bacterium]